MCVLKLIVSICLIRCKYKSLSITDMHKVSLEDKLRIQKLQEQKHGAKAIVVHYYAWDTMLEAYHKLKRKPSTTAELQTTLQKIWNSSEVPQKPVAKAAQNFCKHLQVCVSKAGKHIQYHFSDCNLASKPGFILGL